MKTKISGTAITCMKEYSDPSFYGIAEAKGESNFLYYLKNHLNTQIKNKAAIFKINGQIVIPNIPFIKKRMWKDGHLVSDMQQYLRSKKPFTYQGKKYIIMIWNTDWAITGIEKYWNEGKALLGYDIAEVK
ncbi:MAG: hypothetical protein J7L15_01015 [Clostridiales bacterium]|nr:hypothetical protein [Clostridiales bacterium]